MLVLRRIVRTIVHNWPLKILAIVLASLLYGGLVLSQSARTLNGSVPIRTVNQSADEYVPSDLGSVDGIRYVVPEDLGLRVDESSFVATVDLSSVQPGAEPVSLSVQVSATDPRILVQDFTPRRITVTVDRVTSRTVPIKPVIGQVPAGFQIGDPQLSQTSATVTGPETLVNQVQEADARIRIDPSGIDVNGQIDLVPVDANGNTVVPIDVSPATVDVKVPVFTDRRTRSLPVNPVVTGTPAAGFEVASVTVDPTVVSIEGDANDLAGLDRADTQAISVSGASSDVVLSVGLDLPSTVEALGPATVDVTVHLRPVTASRTFDDGLVLVGARADRTYALSTDQVLVTIGGSVADLDRLSGASLELALDVTGLDVGSHQVAPDANLTTGLTLISVAPTPVTVTIAAPSPSPAPIASP